MREREGAERERWGGWGGGRERGREGGIERTIESERALDGNRVHAPKAVPAPSEGTPDGLGLRVEG